MRSKHLNLVIQDCLEERFNYLGYLSTQCSWF